jgi:hypothetical protein
MRDRFRKLHGSNVRIIEQLQKLADQVETLEIGCLNSAIIMLRLESPGFDLHERLARALD